MIDPDVGKATQFTSENQPDPIKKRVPKYKKKLKEYFINKGIDKLIEIADSKTQSMGAPLKAIEDIKEWVYGKEEQKISGRIDNKTIVQILVEELSKKDEIHENDDKTTEST